MARISTGVSKKQNRVQLAGLNIFYSWRNEGKVSEFNQPITKADALEIFGIEIKTETIPAINLAVKAAEKDTK